MADQSAEEIEAEIAAEIQPNAGWSTCPMCGARWLVTPWHDCMMPRCGHYGHDSTEANPNRPCEPCGWKHANTCPDMVTKPVRNSWTKI